MKSSPLTAEEAAAVRFYEGDLTGLPADDPFYADSKGYVSLNALLFPGISSEVTRVSEGKHLNPAIPADLPRLTAIFRALLSAARKGAQPRPTEGFRVERAADFAMLQKAGRTLSFTSTATGGFLPAYGDKQSIVLLHCTVPAGTPCILMAELLDEYRKADEQELLLPPGLTFSADSRPLTDAERRITDQNGNPPAAAYEVRFTGQYAPLTQIVREPLPFPAEACAVWTALNAGTAPEALPPAAVRLLVDRKACLAQWLLSAAIIGE